MMNLMNVVDLVEWVVVVALIASTIVLRSCQPSQAFEQLSMSSENY